MRGFISWVFPVFVCFNGNAQWVDKQKMADSLQVIANQFINKAKLYQDSSYLTTNILFKVKYDTMVLGFVDSSKRYIVWSEEEIAAWAKEELQTEGLRLALKGLALKKVDSTSYKQLDSMYHMLYNQWIADLKNFK